MSSKHVDRQERRDSCSSGTPEEQLLNYPTKTPKLNKNENHEHVREDPLYSDIAEALQEFRENLVNDRVPERRDSHASSSHEPSFEPMRTRSADLGKHSVYTHFPKDRNCEICQRTKITRAPCRRRIGGSVPHAENFCDWIAADHKVLSEGCESRNNHRYAVVVQDFATQWIQSYPCKTKTSLETQRSLQKFLEPNWSFTLTIWQSLSWNHCTGRKHMGLLREQYAEWKKVRLQYCCNQVWMKKVGRFRGMLYLSAKRSRSLVRWEDPNERRFGKPFKGPIIPFGSLFEYHPVTAKDQSRIHQFGKKVLLGLFLGYELYAGWYLEGWRTGCRPWGVGDDGRIGNLLKKTQCKGSQISQTKWKNSFSQSQMDEKFFGGDQELRTSTLIRKHPIRGEGHVDFLGKLQGSLPQLQDSLPEAREARNDFWSIVRKLHIPPSCWTQSQTLLAERRIIHYSTEMHWRLQNYSWKLGC